MRKEVDIIFIIEHKSRELGFIEIISRELTHSKVSFEIISVEWNLYKLLKLKSKIIVLPWAIQDKEWPTVLFKKFNGLVISLNWEQYLIPLAEEFRRPKGDFTRNHILHYSWGEFFTKFLIESGVNRTNIIEDINPSIITFSSKVNIVKKAKRIFCPLNYAWSFKSDSDVEKICKHKGFDRFQAFEIRDYAVSERNSFLRLMSKMIDKGYEIIIRPHPSITVSQYENLEYFDHRIQVAKFGGIQDNMNGISACISSWSTSLLIFSELGIPAFSFKLKPYPTGLSGEWLNSLKTFSDIDGFEKLLEDHDIICETNSKKTTKTILTSELLKGVINRSSYSRTINDYSLTSLAKLFRTWIRDQLGIFVPNSIVEDKL